MDQTAIKAGPPLPPAAAPASSITVLDRPAPVARPRKHWARQGLEVVASLRLTVVLFTLAIFLVFFGTWAQKEISINAAVDKYFRSLFVWIPLKVLFMYSMDGIRGSIPYPGGWLLGGLLLANVLAAHAIRFKMTWRRSGIFLIHAGLIVIMIGELVAGIFQVEGHMTIVEGAKVNYKENTKLSEFAVVDRSDPLKDVEVVIPERLLVKGQTIQDAALPFDIEIVDYMSNADFQTPKGENLANAGAGRFHQAIKKDEAAGVDQEQSLESPTAYVRLKEKGTGKELGTYLVSILFSYLQRPMDEVVVAGKKYSIALRYKREYCNFVVQLDEFRFDKYLGTEIAKNYSSDVRVIDPKTNEVREDVKIYMNHPLRYEGETFYQSGVYGLARGTVLQVVRNPGWLLPYISCVLVSIGMLVHFGLHLYEFLQKRFAA